MGSNRAPVPAAQFADATKHKEWIEQKGMTVFSFHNPSNPMLTIDVFVQHPIPFTELRLRAERMAIDGVPVYICSIDDLITLKQLAGRPQDLIDIEKLRRIQEKRKRGEH